MNNAIEKHTSAIHPVRQITLDEQWREAESLGRVEVDCSILSKSYEVKISWKRHTGSWIHAVGNHSDISVAMGRAINEARELGAGNPNENTGGN